MGRLLKVHYCSLLLSSIFFETAFAEVPCQRGVDYKNSCNPYRVEFVKLRKTPQVANEEAATKASKKPSLLSRSYLNHLLEKYSSRYDGRSGLQALIDRSKYGLNKKKKPPKKKIAVAQTVEQKIEPKKSEFNKTNQKTKTIKAESVIQKSSVQAKVKEPSRQKPQIVKGSSESLPLKKSVTTVSPKPTKAAKQTIKPVKNQNIASNKTHVAQIEKNRTKLLKESTKKSVVLKDKAAEVKKSKRAQKAKVEPKVQAGYATYIVQKGDTLISIAKQFKISKKRLAKLNKVNANGVIKLGQHLKLPLKYADKIKKFATKKVAVKFKKRSVYIVKKGDTLSRIAKKVNLSMIQLREFNRLARSSKIKVGQKLLLKAPKIVKRRNKSFDYMKNIKFTRSAGMRFKRKLRVIATAYTSHRNQTDRTPLIAAWNNRIRPGMKIIAVSRDLITRYGLKNGSRVRIGGLKGYYVVRDKMNKRFRRRIDIYMGFNKRRALNWGRRNIVLYW